MWPLSSRGGGSKASVAGPLKKNFFAASLKLYTLRGRGGGYEKYSVGQSAEMLLRRAVRVNPRQAPLMYLLNVVFLL